MMSVKKIDLKLSPQNDEWMKMIPNIAQNRDIILNKLIEVSINDGLLLEIISQSLTITDLSKFKDIYTKMYTERAQHISDLENPSIHIERKKKIHVEKTEVYDDISCSDGNPIPLKAKQITTQEKNSNGFDEQTF